MTTRWARFGRGWIAAAVSVFVALCSHALAGGSAPGFAGIALCLAFAGMVCIALAGKSLSLPRLAGSVVASQVLFHGAFSLLGSAAPPSAIRPMDIGLHLYQLHLQSVHSTMSMSAWTPVWMWTAHVIAAVITVLALRLGERTFWLLLALARPFLLSLFGWVGEPRAHTPRPAGCNCEALPRRLAIVSMVSLRGPPASSAL